MPGNGSRASSSPMFTERAGVSLQGASALCFERRTMPEGKPTGIKGQDVAPVEPRGITYVTFEGKRAAVTRYVATSSPEILELGFGDSHLRLYGYFDGEEFMEVDRQAID